MINLCHRGNGGFASATRDPLLNGDTGRQAADQIDIRLLQLLYELPCIRRHTVEKTSLALREKNIKCERGFAGATQTGNYDELLSRNFYVDVFQVVLARTVDLDCAIRSIYAKTRSFFSSSSHFHVVILSVS